ncbi:MAG: S8 family serine peptidase [Thermoplasmatales archaeon]|nr:MAG: S8 family serine peptidase [Thermoplasmatales archaeon]
MKKKLVVVFVFILLISTAIPAIGNINRIKNEKRAFFEDIETLEFAPGEFIVKLTKDTTIKSPNILKLNEKYQVNSIKKIFRRAENTILDNIYLLNVKENSDILSIVKDYSLNPDVLYVEPNGVVYPAIIPNDEYFDYQWALHNTGQNFIPPPSPPMNGTPDCDIDAPEAWEIEPGGSDVVIAIVDSGINYTHPDLADKIWINEDEIPDNGIDDDSNGYIDDIRGWDFYYNNSDPMDGHGHGTLCAGVPGMINNNSIGGAGACWNCQIMPVKIASETWVSYWEDIAIGIIYAADNEADIISLSFGTYQVPNIVKDAVDYAYSKGAFLIACAHNHNVSTKCYPAAYENVTAVAATNQHDERCDGDDWGPGSGSNYGDWVDIAAPGNLIFTTSIKSEYNYYRSVSGTSFSTPLVAGVAALILSKNPYLLPDDVKSYICENVDPYNSTYYIGTGRINAYKALSNVSIPRESFLIGLITNRTTGQDSISFNAKMVVSIGSNPFGFKIYNSNEKIIVSKDKLGYVGKRLMVGFFTVTVI